MANSDGKFVHESLQDRKSVKHLLDALTKAIGKGEIQLRDDEDELILPVDKLLTMRIKASRSNGQCTVGIRLFWTEDRAAPKETSEPSIQ